MTKQQILILLHLGALHSTKRARAFPSLCMLVFPVIDTEKVVKNHKLGNGNQNHSQTWLTKNTLLCS